MSKLTVHSHLSRVITLPWPLATPEKPCAVSGGAEMIALIPGPNEVSEEVLCGYAEHPQVKPLLLAGDADGLELTAEDGAPVAHAEALQALYPAAGEKLPGMINAARERVYAERRKLQELMANATKDKPDMSA